MRNMKYATTLKGKTGGRLSSTCINNTDDTTYNNTETIIISDAVCWLGTQTIPLNKIYKCHGFMKFSPTFLGENEIKFFSKQIT